MSSVFVAQSTINSGGQAHDGLVVSSSSARSLLLARNNSLTNSSGGENVNNNDDDDVGASVTSPSTQRSHVSPLARPSVILFVGAAFPPLWCGGLVGMCKPDAPLCVRWMDTASATLGMMFAGSVLWATLDAISCQPGSGSGASACPIPVADNTPAAVPSPAPFPPGPNFTFTTAFPPSSNTTHLPGSPVLGWIVTTVARVWGVQVLVVAVAGVLTTLYATKAGNFFSWVTGLERKVGRGTLAQLLTTRLQRTLLFLFSLGFLLPAFWPCVSFAPYFEGKYRIVCCCEKNKPQPTLKPCAWTSVAALYLVSIVMYEILFHVLGTFQFGLPLGAMVWPAYVLPACFGISVFAIALYLWQCCPQNQETRLRKAYAKMTKTDKGVFSNLEKVSFHTLAAAVVPCAGLRSCVVFCCRNSSGSKLAKGIWIFVLVESIVSVFIFVGLAQLVLPSSNPNSSASRVVNEIGAIGFFFAHFGYMLPGAVFTPLAALVVCRVKSKRQLAMRVSAIRTLAANPDNARLPLLLQPQPVVESVSFTLRRYVERGEPSHNVVAVAKKLLEYQRQQAAVMITHENANAKADRNADANTTMNATEGVRVHIAQAMSSSSSYGSVDNGSVCSSANSNSSASASSKTNATLSSDDDVNPDPELLAKAKDMLRTACMEIEALMHSAARSGNFASAAAYQEQLDVLTSVAPFDKQQHSEGSAGGSSASTSTTSNQQNQFQHHNHQRQSKIECVAPGLLLRTDRFDANSDAFLGRGGSAAVSRGTLVEQIGRKEVRTTVAVKEIPKTAAQSERKAVHEALLLRRHLREGHPSVIKIFDVKSTSNAFFVVMQHCAFSLANQPDQFVEFLCGPKHYHNNDEGKKKQQHITNGSGGDGGGGKNGGGSLVLGALVRDLLNAVGVLHSKHIVHCDIKVRRCCDFVS